MLSSIHPFGERSRNNRFWLTASAHLSGSVIGGLALGLLFGTIGWASTLVWSSESTGRDIAFVILTVVALAAEARGRERGFPSRSRQVNENWINSYRGWVYGGGFGLELGFGVSTIITTTLVHVMLAAMVFTGSLGASVLIGGLFGFVRGATVLTSLRVDSPERLRQMHRRLDHLRANSRSAGLAALVIAGLLGVTGAIG